MEYYGRLVERLSNNHLRYVIAIFSGLGYTKSTVTLSSLFYSFPFRFGWTSFDLVRWCLPRPRKTAQKHWLRPEMTGFLSIQKSHRLFLFSMPCTSAVNSNFNTEKHNLPGLFRCWSKNNACIWKTVFQRTFHSIIGEPSMVRWNNLVLAKGTADQC